MCVCLLKLSVGNFSEFDHPPGHVEGFVMPNRLDRFRSIVLKMRRTEGGDVAA